MIKNFDRVFRTLKFVLPVGAGLLAIFIYFSGRIPPVKQTEGIPSELTEGKEGHTMGKKDFTPMEPETQVIEIDIKGAVRKPGVYKMEQGDRVIDAVNRAGGLTGKAEEKGVNLSARVKDEMLLYIPSKGEEPSERLPGVTETGEQDMAGEPKVNINTAGEQELETLNGIGPSKAKAIIAYREDNGPFKTIEDLLNVPGIGEKSLENIKELINID